MHSRFKALNGFGDEDLEELKASKVAVIGLGATGSVIAEHLARHGVKLVLIDRDYLEPKDSYSSNLYTPDQCESALPKTEAAADKLSELTTVETFQASLGSGNTSMLDGCDLVMDGTDNLETRFLLNEYSKREGVPWIYTAALAEKGYSMLFDRNCFSCMFEQVRGLETCETAGIMREVSSIAASESALKAIRFLTDKQPDERLHVVPSGEQLMVEKTGCEVCRGEEFPHLNSSRNTASLCGENKYHVELDVDEVDTERLKQAGDVIAENEYLVRTEVDGRTFTVFLSGRAIVEAEDEGHAKQAVSEVLGL